MAKQVKMVIKCLILISVVALVSCYDGNVYPCGQPAPLDCVTAYMAEKAGCHTPDFPRTDVFTHEPFTTETPFFRASVWRYINIYEGGIRDATYDLFTHLGANLTVLTWHFSSVKTYGRHEMQYHAPRQIDTVVDTAYGITFNDIQSTVQWPGVERFTIGTGKIYSFIGSREINFERDFPELAAEIARNPDGIAARTHALYDANREVLLRELETEIGHSFATVNRRNILCDSFVG